MSKICSRCHVSKPLDEFHNRKAAKDGKQTYCKPCAITKVVTWQNENPEKFEANWKKHIANPETLLKRKAKKYNISVEVLSSLMEEADGRCTICKQPALKTLVVDHCHKSLKVRGLLCDKCNIALGLLNDSIENLNSAIKYLEKSKV